MQSIVIWAKYFAIFAHWSVNHKRRYTGEWHWVHLQDVASIVALVDPRPTLLAAAWLHDVVEDTWVTHGLVRLLFGREIAALVYGLTEVSKPNENNFIIRRARLAQQSTDCKTIKLASLISNGRDIAKRDPRFAWININEKKLMLEVLREGNVTLQQWVQKHVDEYDLLDRQ